MCIVPPQIKKRHVVIQGNQIIYTIKFHVKEIMELCFHYQIKKGKNSEALNHRYQSKYISRALIRKANFTRPHPHYHH